jgi:hypothetical protein
MLSAKGYVEEKHVSSWDEEARTKVLRGVPDEPPP